MSDLFREFIDVVFDGNQAKAAAALEVTPSLVSRILSRDRKITPALAEKAERLSDGRFPKERFVWPEQEAA